MEKYSKASIYVAGLSALIALVSLGFSWNTATKQTYRDRIDVRISNCVAVANLYASQAWAYSSGVEEPDRSLEEYSHKAIAIGRAAQLCRNENEAVSGLRRCISKKVDEPSSHKVTDKGSDGQTYENLVC